MGRPRQFDDEALLGAAMELFWSDGYTQTSLENVAKSSGVGNGSIYAAYGSKQGLYLATLQRYCRTLTESVERAMRGRTGDIRISLRAYLEMVICDCTSQPGRRGCFMLNSIALADRLPEIRRIIAATNTELERLVQARLERDLDAPGADLSYAHAMSAHFVALSQGLIQRSRLGDDPATLRQIADCAVSHLAVDTA